MDREKWATYSGHSGRLLRSAKKLAALLDSPEVQPERQSLCLGVVLFSAMTVEAFFNDLPHMAYLCGDAALVDALDEVEDSRGSVRLKFLVTTVVLGRPISKGEEPYQSLSLLFRVRDAVVHLRPHGYTVKDDVVTDLDHARLLDDLFQRDLIADPRRLPTDFLAILASPRLCRWSVETALRVMVHVAKTAPHGDLKKVVTLGLWEEMGMTVQELDALCDEPSPRRDG